ncbi:hypothetical protein ACFP81_11635 [Deinococcus lacus]|uniref:DUF4139 domain-containing protein n=1 Tax=Deinococcus lacus TaxID=392561 RepID=A0ABW1YAY3_9DEIO
MNNSFSRLALVSALLTGVAAAQTAPAEVAVTGAPQTADLRLYQNFAEVRTPITVSGRTFELRLPETVVGGLIPGTLDIEGLRYSQAVQKLDKNALSEFEGREVKLLEDGKQSAVTLVRADDLTIRDAEGFYRQVRLEQLAFPALLPKNPLAPRWQSTYTVAEPGSGTLSYLTRSLEWTPRYTLRASGSSAALSALADIRNNSDMAYQIRDTELLAGDVNIDDGRMYREQYAPAPMLTLTSGTGTFASADIAIENRATLNGLYRYGLSQGFTLPAQATVTLPFMQPKLSTFERYAGLNTSFSNQGSKGVMSRFYRLKADQALPGGQLTIREENRLVGQVSVPETAAGEPVEFTVGRDPDMRYVRSVQTLKSDKAGGTYKVTYSFESSKDRVTRAEVSERVYGKLVTVEGATRREDGAIELRVDVPAGGKASKTFTVTLKNS